MPFSFMWQPDLASQGGVVVMQDIDREGTEPPTRDDRIVGGSQPLSDGAVRLLDLAIALAALLFTLPMLVLIAVLIRLQGEGPVFFAHRRIGRGGQSFDCLKFRSMVVDADRRLQAFLATSPTARAEWDRDHKLKNDPRITPIGRFLRASSLDELPQLLNVLKGEMSLVGPRPIVAAEIGRYGRYFDLYCSVRPGITGLWQVSGRNDVAYARRVAMDVLYARRRSLTLYLGVLLATIPAVLMRRGAS